MAKANEKPPIYLPKPKANSHKGQNGVVLIIGGSETYHGAPILSALAAMRFCDLVYFYSTDENLEVIKKMKTATPNVICVKKDRLEFALNHADCILVGNGMEPDAHTRSTVKRILATKKKCVLDAAALRVLSPSNLHKNAIVTPHALEFEAAFGTKANSEAAGKMSKKYGCTILLKGQNDSIASDGKAYMVKGGNAGMTKGGTGDVLAGLCAALFSTAPTPLSAAYTASVLNKRAGEVLSNIYGMHFCSEDLAEELAFAAHLLKLD